MVDGRLVEDTVTQDTTRSGKPVYHSDAGRTLYGGGGITPDLLIKQDTLSAAEQDFLKTIQAKSQDVYLSIYDLAFELKGSVKPDFTVTQAWRDELYKRITARGVEVDRKKYDAASRYIDLLLSDRIARLAFGEAAAKVRAVGNDSQLVKAIELLHGGRTQKDLFTQVARVGQK
jgi:carboxyl-terminal processing protease